MGTSVFSELRHQWIGSLCASLEEKRRCRFFVVSLCRVLFCLSEGLWAIWDHDATQTSLEMWLPRETVVLFFGKLKDRGFAWSLMLLGDCNFWPQFRGVWRRPTGGGKCGFAFFIFPTSGTRCAQGISVGCRSFVVNESLIVTCCSKMSVFDSQASKRTAVFMFVRAIAAQVGSHSTSGFSWTARVATLLVAGPAARRLHTVQSPSQPLEGCVICGFWLESLASWWASPCARFARAWQTCRSGVERRRTFWRE